MENAAKIVLAMESKDVAEEVMDFLDRTAHARVVGAATTPNELSAHVAASNPDAVVGSPALVRAIGNLNGTTFLALAARESVRVLRDAVECGASGFYVWPSERRDLGMAALKLRTQDDGDTTSTALVVAVYGSRGGCGSTFLSTHLARSFAKRRVRTVLIDADQAFADLTSALGVPVDPPPRTVSDLLAVREELTQQHVREVLWHHPEGFNVLLAPAQPGADGVASICASAVAVASRMADVVLLHLPRAWDATTKSLLRRADRIVVPVTLDVISLKAARRLEEQLSAEGTGPTIDIAVNKASRSEITPSDVERVFGKTPIAVIRADRRASKAQDRGKLLPERSAAVKAIDRLAGRLVEDQP